MEKQKRPGLKAMSKAFGSRLRKLRVERGLTQRDLARLVGCETVLISRYERGEGLPKFDTLTTLTQALRVSMDELALGRTGADPAMQLPIQNVLLLERFRELDSLPRAAQETAISILDGVIAKHELQRLAERVKKSA